MSRRPDIERLQDELEELFEDLWRGPRFGGLRTGFRPHVDTFLTEDPPALTVVVELAGLSADDLHVVIAGDLLILSGHRRRPGPAPDRRASWYQMEIPNGPFERRVRLPQSTDGDRAIATYEAGLLTIVLPLAPEPATPGPVSIPVKGSR